MKKVLLLMTCFVSMHIHAQEVKAAFDGHTWEAPYHLAIPKDWTIERFLIPISFAPQIPYKGVEDIRFAPGWGNVKSEEYWSYAFLWYLDGKPQVSAAIIERNLKAYYTGLIKVNTDSTRLKSAREDLKEVRTAFKELKAEKGDMRTFSGKVQMMDYMQWKRMELNCKVHVRRCSGDKTIMFFELSPKSYSEKIWLNMNELWRGFNCCKK